MAPPLPPHPKERGSPPNQFCYWFKYRKNGENVRSYKKHVGILCTFETSRLYSRAVLHSCQWAALRIKTELCMFLHGYALMYDQLCTSWALHSSSFTVEYFIGSPSSLENIPMACLSISTCEFLSFLIKIHENK